MTPDSPQAPSLSRSQTQAPRYLSTKGISMFLGVSPRYVLILINTGRLPCQRRRKASRTTYLPTTDELESYLLAYEPSMLGAFHATFPMERSENTRKTRQ